MVQGEINDFGMPYLAEITLDEYCLLNFSVGADGFLYRVRSKGKPCKPRRIYGWLLKGYRQVTCKFNRQIVDVSHHRLAFFVKHRRWPETVDHRDRNPLNNNISNLRAATIRENVRNHGSFSTNKNSLPVGVCRRSSDGKFLASVQINGKTRVWAFWKVEEAIAFRAKKAKEVYGDFAP